MNAYPRPILFFARTECLLQSWLAEDASFDSGSGLLEIKCVGRCSRMDNGPEKGLCGFVFL